MCVRKYEVEHTDVGVRDKRMTWLFDKIELILHALQNFIYDLIRSAVHPF